MRPLGSFEASGKQSLSVGDCYVGRSEPSLGLKAGSGHRGNDTLDLLLPPSHCRYRLVPPWW